MSPYFNNSPAINIGLEIPFTKSHIWSFELSTHSWLARFKPEYENDYYIDSEYINIKQNYYTQIGVLGVIKYYITGSKKSLARLYLQFGMAVGPMEYGGLVIGTGINYKLNDNLRLQLDGRIIFGVPNIDDGFETTSPNLIMLNICYNFKW